MTEKKHPKRYDVFLNMVCLESTENLLTMKEMIETELRKREQEKMTTEALHNLHTQLAKRAKTEEAMTEDEFLGIHVNDP